MRDGEAGERRWRRRRAGEGRTGRLLKGSKGVLAVGQVVERLPRVARRVQAQPWACPAPLYVRPAIAPPRCSGTPSGPATCCGGPASESPPRRSGRQRYRHRRLTLKTRPRLGCATSRICRACTCWAPCARGSGRGPSTAGTLGRAASATGGACAPCRATPRPHSKPHIPPELRLAAVLQLGPHFRSHAPHQVRPVPYWQSTLLVIR